MKPRRKSVAVALLALGVLLAVVRFVACDSVESVEDTPRGYGSSQRLRGR